MLSARVCSIHLAVVLFRVVKLWKIHSQEWASFIPRFFNDLRDPRTCPRPWRFHGFAAIILAINIDLSCGFLQRFTLIPNNNLVLATTRSTGMQNSSTVIGL